MTEVSGQKSQISKATAFGTMVLALCSLLLAPCSAVEAQQLAKMPRIGFLNALFPTTNPARIEAFRQGLRDIGYVEGKNIVIEYRYAERKFDRLPPLPLRWCVSK